MEKTVDPEDVFVLPEALRDRLHPRRGGTTVIPFVADPGQYPRADGWITERGLRSAALAAVESASLPDLLRVRAALACAPEAEFGQVVAAVEPYRCGPLRDRIACSVLIPRPDWVDEDVAAALSAGDWRGLGMLLYAASTRAQADAIIQEIDTGYEGPSSDAAITLADGAGAAAAPALLHWLDDWSWHYNDQTLLAVLAALPGDDAMRGLLDRSGRRRPARAALVESIERFPARAVRILAETGDELLGPHLVKHLDLVDQVVPMLSETAAGRVRAVVGAWDEVAVAPLSAVPPVLADPPWRNRKRAVKPTVIAGLTCTAAAAVSWLPGERQKWAERASSLQVHAGTDWRSWAEDAVGGAGPAGWFFALAPEEIARRALARWRPRDDRSLSYWFPVAAARFETDALPALLTLARAAPRDYAPSLLPFTSPEVATLMADWSARLKSVRRVAHQWLTRHPEAAARALIPAALGKAGTARRQAARALILLHGTGHTGHIRAAAAGYGPEAAAGVEALLAADPLAALPVRMPAPPDWADPLALPPVRLRDGSGALPVEAAANLVLILMISRPDDPYAGLDLVRQAVEPATLAEFGWALLGRWLAAGGVAKEGWVLDAVASTGDDEIVRRLTPLIMSWPTEGLTARAVAGLSTLVGIGTDTALMHLHRISQRAKSAPLRQAAAARITETADGLGLTAEQLADRLVPDFGLDADGSLRLDYGPRRFVVGFDEQLRPFAADDDGRRLKALPKPGARDDAERAEAAYRRFSALKREVRKISVEQVRRLEAAMVAGRRWTGAEFRRLFVEHPLMWHIGRRLVWARFDDSGAVVGTLRIAEDRSLADVEDEPAGLGDDDLVGLAHPAQLGEAVAGWGEVFADYQILQPFPQLGRPVFTFTEAETGAWRLDRFEGVTVETTRLLALDRRGWLRHEAANGGIQRGFDRPAGPGRVLTVHLDPGIVGQVGFAAEQKLTAVYLHDGGAGSWDVARARTVPLGDLAPVIASEILRDLTDVTA